MSSSRRAHARDILCRVPRNEVPIVVNSLTALSRHPLCTQPHPHPQQPRRNSLSGSRCSAGAEVCTLAVPRTAVHRAPLPGKRELAAAGAHGHMPVRQRLAEVFVTRASGRAIVPVCARARAHRPLRPADAACLHARAQRQPAAASARHNDCLCVLPPHSSRDGRLQARAGFGAPRQRRRVVFLCTSARLLRTRNSEATPRHFCSPERRIYSYLAATGVRRPRVQPFVALIAAAADSALSRTPSARQLRAPCSWSAEASVAPLPATRAGSHAA